MFRGRRLMSLTMHECIVCKIRLRIVERYVSDMDFHTVRGPHLREFSATRTVDPSWSDTASQSGKKPATVGRVANTTETRARARLCREKRQGGDGRVPKRKVNSSVEHLQTPN